VNLEYEKRGLHIYSLVYLIKNNNFAFCSPAHPNVRLFITHGGLLSIQETILRGVPVVGIPIFGDQRLNMARAVSAGYGIQLEYVDITAEYLGSAIKEALENPR
jgi:UDP:flavonoid glycosyltransferase YjiC (YdhE family)